MKEHTASATAKEPNTQTLTAESLSGRSGPRRPARATEAYSLQCWRCSEAVEIPHYSTQCPLCRAPLTIAWLEARASEAASTRQAQLTVTDGYRDAVGGPDVGVL